MSRIASYPVSVPSGVKVDLQQRIINVEGPKGKMSLNLPAEGVELNYENDSIQVTYIKEVSSNVSGSRNKAIINVKALAGTIRALVDNIVIGVSQGYEKKLAMVGVGYRAQAQGSKLNISAGFSHPVVFDVPQGITIETPSQTEIVIKGVDKQQVGQVAANIRSIRPPEPYEGKGIRYADERVIMKETKKK